MCRGCHIHVHGEDSVLDGLNKVKDLVLKAKSLGHTAVGLTDHGVCAGIPDLIKYATAEGIKPLPGVELYITRDHYAGSSEMAALKAEIMEQFQLTKKKAFDDYVRFVHRQNYQFQREEVVVRTNEIIGHCLLEIGVDIEAILYSWYNAMYRLMDARSFHLVVIAKNNEGLADLYEIVSESHLNGFYGDPRISLQWIREKGLGENLIATSACLGSYSSQLLMAGRNEEAIQHLRECQETFGHFYLEKQATYIPEQLFINDCMDRLSIQLGVPKVLTTDVHYANKEDHSIHDIAVTAGIGKCLNDPDRMQYAHEFWMKTEEEMLERCHDVEAWENTLEIANMVNVTLQDKPLFPKFEVPDDTTPEELLRSKAWQGLFELCLRNKLDFSKYSERLAYELDVICHEGFADYFLITEDFIRATREAGFLVGPGRGSGAGALVCEALKITQLDPIKEDLLFERFLNPERAGYPDLDIDFSYEASQFVYHYLCEKYGADRIAQIGTKGTLAARVVCRKIGKTLGYDLSIQDAFAKSIPEKPGIKLRKAFEESEQVRMYAQQYPDWWQAMLTLEGNVSSLGVHAAGIVLSPVKVSRVVPLRRDKQGKPTTQFDMKWVENFLVKFDILKLDTLDLIQQTMINAGIQDRDINEIDLEDPYVYETIFRTGNLSGVFQFESPGMRKTMVDLKPTRFADLGVVAALYRPGPMDLIPDYVARKHGRAPIRYPFQELEGTLYETFGVYVYQEQIMACSRVLGGLTMGQADMIRKGVSKKKFDLMSTWIDLMIYGSEEYKRMQAALVVQYPYGTFKDVKEMEGAKIWVDYEYEKVPHIEGAIARGFDLEKLLKLKEEWLKFGEYCFNKSHSSAYAKIGYQTAWLKAYYPVEFWAALLSLSEDKKDGETTKNSLYIKEIKQHGINILAPSITFPTNSWAPVVFKEPILEPVSGRTIIGNIHCSLSSIAGVTPETVQEIQMMDVKAIKNFGHFLDMLDEHKAMCKSSGIRSRLNKKVIINLIKGGSFDTFDQNRNKLIRAYLLYSKNVDEMEDYPEKTTKQDIMMYEKEVIGTLMTYDSRWEKMQDKEKGQFTGIVEGVTTWEAKKSGKTHYYVDLNIGGETIQCTVWSHKFSEWEYALRQGNKVTLYGEKGFNRLTVERVTLKEEVVNVPHDICPTPSNNFVQYDMDMQPV